MFSSHLEGFPGDRGLLVSRNGSDVPIQSGPVRSDLIQSSPIQSNPIQCLQTLRDSIMTMNIPVLHFDDGRHTGPKSMRQRNEQITTSNRKRHVLGIMPPKMLQRAQET